MMFVDPMMAGLGEAPETLPDLEAMLGYDRQPTVPSKTPIDIGGIERDKFTASEAAAGVLGMVG